jgi:hypothetical protein
MCSQTHVPIIQHVYNTLAETLATINVETGPKLQKYGSRQTLHEDVCELGCQRHVQDANIINGHTFPHKVEVDLDILRVLVLNRVGGEVDGANVVAVDKCALCQWSVELLK